MPGSEKGLPPQEALPENITTASNGTSQGSADLRRPEGHARRDAGMATALEAVQPAWRDYADDVLDALIASGRRWTSDDVRRLVGEPYATGSARALGGLIRARAQRGEIAHIGWSISTQPQRHMAPARIWQAVQS
jgi:hypothetical protein